MCHHDAVISFYPPHSFDVWSHAEIGEFPLLTFTIYILCVLVTNPTTGCQHISWGSFWLPPSHSPEKGVRDLSKSRKVKGWKVEQKVRDRLCCWVEVYIKWAVLLWNRIRFSVIALKRLQGVSKAKWVLEILGWHWPFCFVCIALTQRLLKLLVNCLAHCWWECYRNPQIRFWVPLCWSDSLPLWPWKRYCPEEWQQSSRCGTYTPTSYVVFSFISVNKFSCLGV